MNVRGLWRNLACFGVGLGISVGLYWLLALTVEWPDDWLAVYVSSDCGSTSQVLSDVDAAALEPGVAVLPLDDAIAEAACARTVPALASHGRPWLALLPDSWSCALLRRAVIRDQEQDGEDWSQTPVYQLDGKTMRGWSPVIRELMIEGDRAGLSAMINSSNTTR